MRKNKKLNCSGVIYCTKELSVKNYWLRIFLLWIITGVFTSITIATISFAIRDRRTMIRPFEVKVRDIVERIEEMDKGKVEKLILALQEISKTDGKVEMILKKFNLL